LRQMRRDKFTKLMQCVRIILGRRLFFHTSDSLVGIHRRPLFYSGLKRPITTSYGMTLGFVGSDWQL
jgi:hypothetical protein